MRFSILAALALLTSFHALAQKDSAAVYRFCQPQTERIVQKTDSLIDERDYTAAGHMLSQVDVNDTLYLDYIVRAAKLLSNDTSGEKYFPAIMEQVAKYHPNEWQTARLLRLYYHLSADRADSVLALTDPVLRETPSSEDIIEARWGELYFLKRYGQLYEEARQIVPYQPYNGALTKKLALAAYHERKYGQFYAWAFFGLANYTTRSEANSFATLIEKVMSEGKATPPEAPSLPYIAALDEASDMLQSGIAGMSGYKYDGPLENYKLMKQIHHFFKTIGPDPKMKGNTALETMVMPYLLAIEADGRWPIVVKSLISFLGDKQSGKKDPNRDEFEKWIEVRAGYLDKVPAFQQVTYRGKSYRVSNRYLNFHGGPFVLVDAAYDAKSGKPRPMLILYRGGAPQTECFLDNQERLQGEFVSYHTNGQKRVVKSFVDGNVEGLELDYNRFGKLVYKSNYKNNAEDGEVVWYFPSGGLTKRYHMAGGKFNGTEALFHETGYVKDSALYRDSQLEGEHYHYYSSGRLHWMGTATAGTSNGPRARYYETGVKEVEYVTKNGEVHGSYTTFHPNGRLKLKQRYDNGKLIDSSYFYDEDGNLTEIDVQGSSAGARTEYYYTDGKRVGIATYKDDLPTTLHYYDMAGKELFGATRTNKGSHRCKVFAANGMPVRDYQMLDGKTHGAMKRYNRFGAVISEEYYLYGLQQGKATYYHPDGTVSAILHYKDGEEDGLQMQYHENGMPKAAYVSVNGKKQGYYCTFDAKGRLSYRGFFRDGIRDGWVQWLDSTGSPTLESRCYDDYSYFYRQYQGRRYFQYEETRLNGPITVRDVDGREIYKLNYRFGFKDGKQITMGPSGKPFIAYEMVKGYKSGRRQSFDENGDLVSEDYYDGHGIQAGQETRYYQGKVVLKETNLPLRDSSYVEIFGNGGKLEYVGGERSGEVHGWRTYYDHGTGTVAGFVLYDEGDIVGYADAGANGKRINEVRITEAKADVVTHYPNGRKSMEFSLLSGKRNGVFRKYFENGTPMAEFHYRNGEQHGPSLEYYPDGTLQQKEYWLCGSRFGQQIIYHPNGKPREVATFYNNDKVGALRFYAATGALEAEYEYYQENVRKVK